MADAWIDGLHMTCREKKAFATSLIEQLTIGENLETNVTSDPQSRVFARCAVVFSFARSRLIELPR